MHPATIFRSVANEPGARDRHTACGVADNTASPILRAVALHRRSPQIGHSGCKSSALPGGITADGAVADRESVAPIVDATVRINGPIMADGTVLEREVAGIPNPSPGA